MHASTLEGDTTSCAVRGANALMNVCWHSWSMFGAILQSSSIPAPVAVQTWGRNTLRETSGRSTASTSSAVSSLMDFCITCVDVPTSRSGRGGRGWWNGQCLCIWIAAEHICEQCTVTVYRAVLFGSSTVLLLCVVLRDYKTNLICTTAMSLHMYILNLHRYTQICTCTPVMLAMLNAV